MERLIRATINEVLEGYLEDEVEVDKKAVTREVVDIMFDIEGIEVEAEQVEKVLDSIL